MAYFQQLSVFSITLYNEIIVVYKFRCVYKTRIICKSFACILWKKSEGFKYWYFFPLEAAQLLQNLQKLSDFTFGLFVFVYSHFQSLDPLFVTSYLPARPQNCLLFLQIGFGFSSIWFIILEFSPGGAAAFFGVCWVRLVLFLSFSTENCQYLRNTKVSCLISLS